MNRYRSLTISAVALVLLIIIVVLAVCLLGDGSEDSPALPPARQEQHVGVCLPAENDAWVTTGQQLQTQLNQQGYQVSLVYGDGTAQTQNRLMLELIAKPVTCLVVAPVDSAALVEAGKTAREQNIPILSYGALLMDTEAVAGYICYNYFDMGAAIANHVAEKYTLTTAEREGRSYTVELFMGSSEDYNALLFYNGVMSVLEPYLSSGVLESKSRRTAFEDSCIYDWSTLSAEKSCTGRLHNSYKEAAPDICICASDGIAGGVISALEKAGISQEDWPTVTGNGATADGIANLDAGKLTLSVRTDPADPAIACCDMVDWVLFGEMPERTMGQISNNAVEVPTALCGFTLVTRENEE